jgi:hypothetical protein
LTIIKLIFEGKILLVIVIVVVVAVIIIFLPLRILQRKEEYTHIQKIALLLFAIFPIFKIWNDNNSDYDAAADHDDIIIINN